MSYAAAIDQLSAMTPELHTQPGQQRRKFSLTEIGTLLTGLQDPHRRFPAVLIAGTNGKGSTASTLASILQASGLRTGLYTSPHLVRPNERIRIDGAEIADDAFARLYFRVNETGQQLVRENKLNQLPSFFETLTAMAFLYFADQAVDFAVLEVGMGGRLDATNIIDPLLSIVTDISLDHTEWLGPTIAAIAREKAGILRTHGTLITLPQHPEANQVLGEVATALGTRAVSAVPYMPQVAHAAAPGNRPSIPGLARATSYPVTALGSQITIDSPLHGEHQHRNIALAIAAAVELATHHGMPITPATIATGVQSTQWPGRLEIITTSPSTAHAGSASDLEARTSTAASQWILDVAHNPAGAWALRAALRLEFGLGEPGAPPATLIFGCLRDKPLAEMAHILFPLFDEIIFAPIVSPRATPVAELLAAAEAVGVPARAAATVEEALTWVDNARSPQPGTAHLPGTEISHSNHPAASHPAQRLAVIAGSVYLVGEIRPILLARAQSE